MPSSSIRNSWKNTWGQSDKRWQIVLGTFIMLSIVFTLPFFFRYIEKRDGILLNDWLLAAVPPHNVSVLIFAVIWGMILLAFIRTLYTPTIYINYCWTLIFVSLARLACIAMVPLAPPHGLLTLTDPLTGIFYGEARITKDLFFSGHMATVVLIFLCLEKRTDKIIGFIAILVLACLLVIQHIHYTIDILAAPVVTYFCFRLTRHYLK